MGNIFKKMVDTVNRKVTGPVPAVPKRLPALFSSSYSVTLWHRDTDMLKNTNKLVFTACAPVACDRVKRISIVRKHNAERYGGVCFYKDSYMNAYACGQGDSATQDCGKRRISCMNDEYMDFSEIAVRGEGGEIERTTIPVLSKMTAIPTNIPHTYYVEYENGGAALVTDDMIRKLCLPESEMSSGLENQMTVQGPRVNFLWRVSGYGYYSAYSLVTVKLASIFMLGEPENVGFFLPGIKDMLRKFFSIIPELDKKRIDVMQESMGGYLGDLCRSLADMDGYRHVSCRQPADFIIEMMDAEMKERHEKEMAEKHKDDCVDGFRELVGIRRELLNEFNRIPVKDIGMSSVGSGG